MDRMARAGVIILDAAMAADVSVTEFTANDKVRSLTVHRRACWTKLHEELGIADAEIGRLFSRDGNAIWYGRKKHV